MGFLGLLVPSRESGQRFPGLVLPGNRVAVAKKLSVHQAFRVATGGCRTCRSRKKSKRGKETWLLKKTLNLENGY